MWVPKCDTMQRTDPYNMQRNWVTCFRKQLLIKFVDLWKDFDSIHCEWLWSILKIYGILQPFVELFKRLYQNSSCCFRRNAKHTIFLEVVSGVRHGCYRGFTRFSDLIFLKYFGNVEPFSHDERCCSILRALPIYSSHETNSNSSINTVTCASVNTSTAKRGVW